MLFNVFKDTWIVQKRRNLLVLVIVVVGFRLLFDSTSSFKKLMRKGCDDEDFSLSMKQNVDGEDAEDSVLEVGVFVHQDGDHSDVRKETSSSTYDVLFREPKLPGRVKSPIIDRVIVTFR